MRRIRFNWNLLLRLVHKYQSDAEKCLESGAYFAGLVSVRAALETLLISRFLLEVLDWSESELEGCGITVKNELIEVKGLVTLKEIIEAIYEIGLLSKSGLNAAERIRVWGNKIHCDQVAGDERLPRIGRRNLEARLNDFDTVSEQLVQTL